MSDHDFEKQVQSKMEQLRLRPSDAVWTKVDKRIRKERRRRRVILWLPLLLLLIAAGGYLLFETNSDNNKFTASDKTSTQTTTQPAQTNIQPAISETTPSNAGNEASAPQPSAIAPADKHENVTSSQAQIPVSNERDQPAFKSDQPGSTPATAPATAKVVTPITAGKAPAIQPDAPESVTANSNVHPKRLRALPTDGISTNAGRKSGKKEAAPVASASAAVQPASKPSRRPAVIPEKNNNIAQHEGKVVSEEITDTAFSIQQPAPGTIATLDPKQEQITDSASTTSQTVPLTPLKPTATKKKTAIAKLPEPPTRKPSTWSFGIVAEGGASHISKGNPFSLLSKKNVEPEDLAQSSPAPSNSFNPGDPAGFTQPPTTKPATLKMGKAWSAGGFAQKKISKRVSLSAGLQYSVFSVKTQVGQYLEDPISVSNANYDQVISGYYQGRVSSMTVNQNFFTASPGLPTTQDYTNKYHFIELPLKIHWRVTNEEQLPIIVDGGLSISHLLSTNALHYDGTNDVYYKDFSYFNKTQAGITAGVNLELFSESNHPVWIGPTIKYQLSNLLKSDLSGGQHLWQFGVGAKVFLKK